jgi:shikimate dehydrogenase
MIINATSIGLKKNDEINLNFSSIGKNKIFYDVIYNPKETNFLKTGKKLGNVTENGKLMFIYQASEAFYLWHGIKPKIDNKTIRLLNNG